MSKGGKGVRIAERMRTIDSSGIRKVFDLAHRMKDPVNLSIGQPEFDAPDELKRAAVEAIRNGRNRYTLTQGIGELREEVALHLKRDKGYEPEEVMITSGVAGGIMLAYLALLDPGDEVIIPDPFFVIYKHLCSLTGAVPVYLDTYPDFELTREALEPLMGERTKLIIVNNPSNPTGAMLASKHLKEIGELAAERGVTVLSDEIYDFFAYDAPHESMGKFNRSTLVLGGFSKSFGVTGWRIGYAAGPAEIIAEMVKLQQYSFVCAPSALQYGVLGAFGLDMSARLSDYRRKRDMVCEGLRDRYRFVKPGGAFYLFPEAPGGSGEEFARRAVERNLLIVPGSVFSGRDTHFRLSYAASDRDLERGIEALRDLA